MLAYWLSPCRLLVKHEVTEAWIQNWYLLYEALLSTASGPPTLLLLPIVPCLPTYLCSKWQFNQILVSKESKVKPGSRWKVPDYLSYSLWMEKWDFRLHLFSDICIWREGIGPFQCPFQMPATIPVRLTACQVGNRSLANYSAALTIKLAKEARQAKIKSQSKGSCCTLPLWPVPKYSKCLILLRGGLMVLYSMYEIKKQ